MANFETGEKYLTDAHQKNLIKGALSGSSSANELKAHWALKISWAVSIFLSLCTSSMYTAYKGAGSTTGAAVFAWITAVLALYVVIAMAWKYLWKNSDIKKAAGDAEIARQEAWAAAMQAQRERQRYLSEYDRYTILAVARNSAGYKNLVTNALKDYAKPRNVTPASLSESDPEVEAFIQDTLRGYIEFVGEDEERNPIFEFITPKDGTTDVQVASMADALRDNTGMYEVRDISETSGTVRLIFFRVKQRTQQEILIANKVDHNFYANHPCVKDNPARDIFKIPLALTADGLVWSMPLHHTLVVGRTGSGKGSVVQGTICQLTPAVRLGLVKLYMCDPKNAEGLGYDRTDIFTQIGVDIDEMVDTVRAFYESMQAMKKGAARRNAVTTERPLAYLIIDEFPSLKEIKSFMNAKDDNGLTIEEILIQIMAQGRSLNHYLMICSQESTIEAVGRLRKNMSNFISLQIESVTEVAILMGAENIENGSVTHPIMKASEDNGYISSGIANVREGDKVQLVRFAYMSDDAIDQLQEDNLKQMVDSINEDNWIERTENEAIEAAVLNITKSVEAAPLKMKKSPASSKFNPVHATLPPVNESPEVQDMKNQMALYAAEMEAEEAASASAIAEAEAEEAAATAAAKAAAAPVVTVVAPAQAPALRARPKMETMDKELDGFLHSNR